MKWLKKFKAVSSKKFSKPVTKFSGDKFHTALGGSGRLKNKIALVTGAGKGIGRAIAKCFANEGARVLINARTHKDLESLANEIKHGNGDCHIFAGDVTNPETVRAMFTELKFALWSTGYLRQ